MLYVSDVLITKYKYQITETETGDSFAIYQKDKEYRLDDGTVFDASRVMGYFCGKLYLVSKRMLFLLNYIEDISFVYNAVDCIRISPYAIVDTSVYKVFVRVADIDRVYSVMGIVMDASMKDGFWEMIMDGVLYARFGMSQTLCIKFCGEYRSVISKLVTLRD